MTDTTNAVPHPGSPEAVAKGCTCPILDNAHGGGYLGIPGMFVMTGGCPLHSPETGIVPREAVIDLATAIITSRGDVEGEMP